MRILDEALDLDHGGFYFLIFRVDNSKAKFIKRIIFQEKCSTDFLCNT